MSSALHLAAPSNNPEVLVSLVEHGADINCVDEVVNVGVSFLIPG
jgi:ankyrin repeat protein